MSLENATTQEGQKARKKATNAQSQASAGKRDADDGEAAQKGDHGLLNRGRPETWTLEVAIELLDELLAWMADEKNVFVDDFLVRYKALNADTIDYLRRKFPDSDITTKHKRAKQIQAQKLMMGGLTREYDKTMAIFLLKCCHGFKEDTVMGKSEPEEKASDVPTAQADLVQDIRKRIGK